MTMAINSSSLGTGSGVDSGQNLDSQMQALQRQVQHLQGSEKGVSELIAATSAADPNQAVLEKELQDLQRQIEQLDQRMMQLQEQKLRQSKQQELNRQLTAGLAAAVGFPDNVTQQALDNNGHIDVRV
jgi:predicted transcriptional regulator